MSRLLCVLLGLFLCSLAFCQYSVIEENLAKPIIYTDEFHNDNMTFMLGEDVFVEYQNEFSEFEGKVYERNPPIQGDLLADFAQNRANYKPSNICQLTDAQFEFNDLESYDADDDTTLDAYAVNEHDELVYLLTSKAILLELKYLKNLTLPENATDFGEVAVAKGQKNSMHYHKQTKTLYLLNGKGLFVMQPKKNATTCTQVKGFVDGQTLKRHQWYDDKLLITTQKHISIYKIDKPGEFILEQTIDSYSGQPLVISDAQFSGNSLWVLDEMFGLYKYDRDGARFEQKASYKIPYGIKLMLSVMNDCIQVVFQLYKDTYVAELFLKQNNLYLNRFYDQITGIRKVMLMDELMLVLGETETMLIWHSINQQNLLNMDWQSKKFADGFGVLDLQHVASNSNNTTIALSVLSADGFQFLTVNRSNAFVKCNLQPYVDTEQNSILGSHSIVVQLNSTLCSSQKSNNFSGGNYCKVKHSFNFKVIRPTERKLSMIISVGMFIVSLTLAVVLVAISFSYRKNRRGELEKMRDLLRRRQQQYEKSKNSGIGGPSQIVDV